MSEVYSHSRLATFEKCPRQFEYRYVLRLPAESESVESFVGRRVHEVLERLYEFAGRGLVPSLRRVIERYRIFCRDHWDPERIRVARSGTRAEDYLADGERCLENHYRRHYPFDADETLGLEQRVDFALDAAGDYRMRGIIDRIVRARDGALEIHDFKTGRRIPRQQELDRDRQLALYQLGVGERYGRGEAVRLVWHYLLSGQTRTSSRSPEQIEELRRETIALIDRIRDERDFEPRPSPLCGWCEYADRCPAGARRGERDGTVEARARVAARRPPPPGTSQLSLL